MCNWLVRDIDLLDHLLAAKCVEQGTEVTFKPSTNVHVMCLYIGLKSLEGKTIDSWFDLMYVTARECP